MQISKFIVLITTLLTTNLTLAELNMEESQNIEELPNDMPLKSLTTLQSLKNLDQQKNYQAPFVQELNNNHKVRTLFVASQDLPIVDIQLTFNAGSAQDENIAKGMNGLSTMAARLMSEGTDQFTAKQIANTLEGLGAKLSINAYRDMFTVRLRVLSDPQKLNPAVNMMLHILNHSTFNSSGLNLVLNNTKIGQKQVQENPSRLMGIRFYRAVYGKHPYAEPSVGTNGSIQKITPELLTQFRNKFLVAQNMNIAITGNLSSEQATQLANLLTQNLPQGEKAPELPEPIDQSDFNIQFIPYQSTQANIMLGHLGITREDPDRIALEVANQIFGGSGFNSILMKELRVKRGYTYGAYSTLSSTQARGLFSLSYGTQQDQMMESIRVTHQALIDFIQRPIQRKVLEETKEGMLRSFPMTFSSNANINAQLASIGFYHLPANYLTQYQQQLSQITAKQVQTALKKHIRADRLTFVIVANELDLVALKKMLNENLGIHTSEESTKTSTITSKEGILPQQNSDNKVENSP